MRPRAFLLSAVGFLVLIVAAIVVWRWQFPVEEIGGFDVGARGSVTASMPGGGSAPPGSASSIPSGPTLASYINSLGYQPLKVPRDSWGPGAVVAFDERGNEKIVWFNAQCLNLSTPQLSSAPEEGDDVQVADASLPSTTFERSRGTRADVSLEKALGTDLDLGAAFDDQKLRRIAITISKVRQFVTSTGSVSARVKRLAANSNDCVNTLYRPGNFIIYDALVISDGNFQFYGSDNNLLKVDANLLSQIKAAPALTATLVGSTSLPISAARMVGYKLIQMEPPGHGFGASTLRFREVKSAEIAKLKQVPPGTP